jgi:tRNA (guanine-N7-)-methyltransferase
VADAALDGIQLYFPDPWPKKRHHKRRIVTDAFAALVARKLKSGGYFHAATDWEDYAFWMLERLNGRPELINTAPDGGFAGHAGERTTTRFERRGARLGHAAWDLRYERGRD